jgi:hypothetical protein
MNAIGNGASIMDTGRFESVCRVAATFHTCARAWYIAGKTHEGAVYRDFCEAEKNYNVMMDREFPMALPPEQAARWSSLAVAFGPTKAECIEADRLAAERVNAEWGNR